MKRAMYIGGTLLLCIFSAIGATKLIGALTGSIELSVLAGLAAFIGNLFAIEPIRSPIIK
jgi:hypothetical protein